MEKENFQRLVFRENDPWGKMINADEFFNRLYVVFVVTQLTTSKCDVYFCDNF